MADTTQAPDVEELLAEIVQLKTIAAETQDQLTKHLDRLTALVDEAEIDQSFKFNDWSFSCTSRTTYDYPGEVQEIEQIFKTAKKTAEANGTATAKVGAPSWTIKPPKP
jgi:hypothetical protein